VVRRGMRGTIVYATDPETRMFLAGLVQVNRELDVVYR